MKRKATIARSELLGGGGFVPRSVPVGVGTKGAGDAANQKENTVGYILLWLIGIPIPILIILALLH